MKQIFFIFYFLFYIKTMGVEEGGFKVTCAIT